MGFNIFYNMNIIGKKLYFIGIGGISMSALAKLSISLGALVSGSDIKQNDETVTLEKLNVKINFLQQAKNITNDIDIVIYSSAIKLDNLELKEAKKQNKNIYNRAEFLAEICKMYKVVIAIAGTHGKTTTTGMLTNVLECAGLDPTVHIGGELDGIGNLRIGNTEYFITEACEYDKSFLTLRPNYVVVTNIDYDHVDTYPTRESYMESFYLFCSRCKMNGRIILDDKTIIKNAKCYLKNVKITQNQIKNINFDKNICYSYDFYFGGVEIKNIKLNIPGEFNLYNSSKVVALCLILGIAPEFIKKGLENFGGVKRRFEKKGTFCGANVVIDYAHHPTEIKENIKLAKKLSRGKLYVVFQPHTFSRTMVFWDEFCNAFSFCDEAIIYPIYSAREKPIENIDSKRLCKDIIKKNVNAKYFKCFKDIENYLKDKLSKEDTILILGAGDICNLADYLTNKN